MSVKQYKNKGWETVGLYCIIKFQSFIGRIIPIIINECMSFIENFKEFRQKFKVNVRKIL